MPFAVRVRAGSQPRRRNRVWEYVPGILRTLYCKWSLISTLVPVTKCEWTVSLHVYKYRDLASLPHPRACVFIASWFHPWTQSIAQEMDKKPPPPFLIPIHRKLLPKHSSRELAAMGWACHSLQERGGDLGACHRNQHGNATGKMALQNVGNKAHPRRASGHPSPPKRASARSCRGDRRRHSAP